MIGVLMSNDDGIDSLRVFAYGFQSFTDFSQAHTGVDQQADLIRADKSAVPSASTAQYGYRYRHSMQCFAAMGQGRGYLLE